LLWRCVLLIHVLCTFFKIGLLFLSFNCYDDLCLCISDGKKTIDIEKLSHHLTWFWIMVETFGLQPLLHSSFTQINLKSIYNVNMVWRDQQLSLFHWWNDWYRISKCTNLYRSNKIYKIRIHRDYFNFYSVVTLLLRMFVKWGVHWGNWFDLQNKIKWLRKNWFKK